jgi:CheY-like chemotaxis protein
MLDLSMPVMDGLEAARELNGAYARHPDIDVHIVHKRERNPARPKHSKDSWMLLAVAA